MKEVQLLVQAAFLVLLQSNTAVLLVVTEHRQVFGYHFGYHYSLINGHIVFHRLTLGYTRLEDPSLKKCTRYIRTRCKSGERLRKEMVGMARFELATSAPPVQRANQATLHPEQAAVILVFPAWFSMKKRIPRPIVWSGGYSASFFGSGGLALTVSHR